MSHRIFDEYADRYDSWYERNPVLYECEAKAIRALGLQGRGLSIGVGTGILDSQAPIDVGIDPSANMLRFALKRGVESVRAVGEYLPFKDGSFDFALMAATICFLNSPEKAIIEARRILRCRGELAICLIPRDSSWGREYIRKGRMGHAIYSHAHFYTLKEIKRILEECSFKVTGIKSTLGYSPHEKPKIEEPTDDPRGKGFVCIKAMKT